MPAHKPKQQVGNATLSDGRKLTELDRSANDQADRHAKAAVQTHRVSSVEVEGWKRAYGETITLAKWIARATHEANNQEVFPFKDSEAARWKSEEAAAQRRKAKNQRSLKLAVFEKMKAIKAKITPEQGGHTPIRIATAGKRVGGDVQHVG